MVKFPSLFAHDDACHLKKFVNKRQTSTIGKFLASIKMVVDKMHFPNHIDKWCRANVNPYQLPEFDNLNTEVCEQTFKCVSRFKYSSKHMRFGSYNMFHLTMADMFNNDKLVKSRKRLLNA